MIGGDQIGTESAESFHFANIRLECLMHSALFSPASSIQFQQYIFVKKTLDVELIVAYLSVTMFGLPENLFREQINKQTLALLLIYYSCLVA